MPDKTVRLNSALSVSAILKEHDLPAKIREALATLKAEKQVIPESGLRSDLHVDSNKFARAACLPEFAKFKKELRGKVYWGAPADLAAVERAMEGIYQ